jgi:hypothetical protein
VPTGERVTLLAVSLWFSLREDTRMVALLDIGLILLVLLVTPMNYSSTLVTTLLQVQT